MNNLNDKANQVGNVTNSTIGNHKSPSAHPYRKEYERKIETPHVLLIKQGSSMASTKHCQQRCGYQRVLMPNLLARHPNSFSPSSRGSLQQFKSRKATSYIPAVT